MRFTTLFLATLAMTSSAHAKRVFDDVVATATWRVPVTIPADSQQVWETLAAPGVDPVMHLTTPDGVGLVSNDDSSGLDPRLTYANLAQSSVEAVLVVHAYHPATAGTAQLLHNGAVVGNIPVGGDRVWVPSGDNHYETALTPGGAPNTSLYALTCDSRLLQIDDHGGVGLASRIEGHDNVCSVVVTTPSPSNMGGPTRLLVNDHDNDADDDGLGAQLEAELGTCDSSADPFWYCDVASRTDDTDHDGLVDGAEVFGLEASPALLLPRWGADPLHKDIFVEIDYTDAFGSNPYGTGGLVDTDAFVTQVASYFEEALSFVEVFNPDGQHGITLHLDLGKNPADPSTETRYGWWGGTNQVPPGVSYQDASDTQMQSERKGVFRYALASTGGGGQASGDRFVFGYDSPRHTFTHELGHTLGLAHSGQKAWGSANCKPMYKSLMNYSYGGDLPFGFSHGALADFVVTPAAASEDTAFGGADASFMSVGPFNIPLNGTDDIDWNRDGLVSANNDPVRGIVNWSRWDGCGTFTMHHEDLHNVADDTWPDDAAHTPDLTRAFGDRLFAFFVDDEGDLVYRHGETSGPDADGSCPEATPGGTDCMDWSPLRSLAVPFTPQGVSVAGGNNWLVMAATTAQGHVLVGRYALQGDGSLSLVTGTIFPFGGFTGTPELARIATSIADSPSGEALMLVLVYNGYYLAYTSTNEGGSWGFHGWLRGLDGSPVQGSLGASVVRYAPSDVAGYVGPYTACGVFPDPQGAVQFRCYHRTMERWADLTSTAFPNGAPEMNRKPGLAFNLHRDANGDRIDPTDRRGRFLLAYADGGAKAKARIWFSASVGVADSVGDVHFPDAQKGHYGGHWTYPRTGSGIALYEDAHLSATKGLMLRRYKSKARVHFHPYADGSPPVEMRDGNDFEVMDDGICRKLRGQDWCDG